MNKHIIHSKIIYSYFALLWIQPHEKLYSGFISDPVLSKKALFLIIIIRKISVTTCYVGHHNPFG